jgi:hypothetical protein
MGLQLTHAHDLELYIALMHPQDAAHINPQFGEIHGKHAVLEIELEAFPTPN